MTVSPPFALGRDGRTINTSNIGKRSAVVTSAEAEQGVGLFDAGDENDESSASEDTDEQPSVSPEVSDLREQAEEAAERHDYTAAAELHREADTHCFRVFLNAPPVDRRSRRGSNRRNKCRRTRLPCRRG